MRAKLIVVPLALLLLPALSVHAGRPTHLKEKVEEQLNKGLDPAPKDLDRTTPQRSWNAFIKYCLAKRYELGAHLLNLGDISEATQKTEGQLAARQLCEVLESTGDLGPREVDDTVMGPILDNKPTNYVVPVTIKLPTGQQGEIWERRVMDQASQQQLWIVTRRTVAGIEKWYHMLVTKDVVVAKKVEVINPGLGPIPSKYKLVTPRDTAGTFARLAKEGNFEEAARLLQLSNLSPDRQKKRGPRLARRLAMILKRIHPGGYGRMSNDPDGAREKDVPFDEEVVASTTLDKETVQVRLIRIPRKRGPEVWLFSQATVGDIDPIYKVVGYGWAGDYLPPIFFEWKFWNVQLWQWVGILIALLLGYIFGMIAGYAVRKLLLRLAKFTRWEWDDEVVSKMRGPLIGAFFALGFVMGIAFLGLAPKPLDFLRGTSKLVAILSMGWFFLRLMDVAAEQLMQVFKDRDDDMGVAMIPVARKILKPIMGVIILIVALQNIGVDVSGLLAGLGIGGLAFALAAKDTLANVFGSVAIAFDRPFKVGDFVKVGDLLGSVEDVGLRTTRLRTLDRTVISVPNSQVADSKIENYAPRDRIRLVATFGVQYDTSMDQVRYIIDEVKRYLVAHPNVYQDGFRVRFVEYGDSSMNIEIYCYLLTDDFNNFTALREQIFFDVGEIITKAGAEFAFPSQTVYVGKDGHADSKKAKLAAAEVAKRTEAGVLCIPEIPDEVRQELLNKNLPPEDEKDGDDED